MSTDNWIKLEGYSSVIDDMSPGETERINHEDCPAGEDTKRRLYITKPANDPNLVLGYCHNCNGKGMQSGKTGYRSNFHENNLVLPTIPAGVFKVPDGLVRDPDIWPVHATTWRIEKGLTKDECFEFGIAHDPNTNHIYLPMYKNIINGGVLSSSKFSDLCGYQLRRLEGIGAKYTTVLRGRSTIPSTLFILASKPTKAVVLVEDYASGIAVWQAIGSKVGVLVNYGVKNLPQVLNRVPASMDTGIVWLDNDSPHVEDMARQIARTWGLITGASIAVVTEKSDPKNCTHSKIQELIREAIG